MPPGQGWPGCTAAPPEAGTRGSSAGSISPTADAYVRGGGSAGTNFGASDQLVAKHDAADLNFNRITYLRFDVRELEAVQSAKLKLVPFQVDGPTTLHFERIADDGWSEAAVTWNNRPTAAGTIVASVGGYAVGQTAEIDLTNAVTTEAAGDGILSLRVTNEGWNFVGFHSRESANAALRPVLEYTAAVPAATPGAVKTAHLRFDDGSGPTATDSSGNGWHGALAGGSAWEDGRIEGGLGFESGGHLNLPEGIFTGIDDFTIGFWLKPGALSDGARVFDFSTGDDANGMTFTPRTPEGVMRFSISVGGVAQVLEAPPAVQFPTGSWSHAALVKSGGTTTLYLDGEPVATTAALTHRPSDLGVTTTTRLGGGAFAGVLDDFRIYRGALGPADVAKLADPPPAPVGLKAVPSVSQVNLSWEAVGGASSYTIRRSPVSGGPYETVGTATTTSYHDPSVTNGTTYHYIVAADNGITDGDRSEEAAATPRGFVQSGGIVSMEAEHGILGSRWITTGSASASGGAYIEVDPVHNTIDFAPAGTTAEYVAAYPFDISAAGNHRFWFRVFAPTADDDSFFWRVDGGNWTMENGRAGDGTWYAVDNAQLDNLSTGGHLLEIVYRENGTGLDKFVIQPDGHAAPVGHGPAETVLPPAPGVLAVVAVLPSRIDLAWSAVPGASGYRLKRSTASGGPYTTVADDLTVTNYSDAAVATGTTYHYIVTAVNGIGESGTSARVSATPSAQPITEAERRPPALAFIDGEAVLATAASVAGRLYQLQVCDDLTAGDWQPLGEPQSGAGEPLEFVVPFESGTRRRFFRLLILQP